MVSSSPRQQSPPTTRNTATYQEEESLDSEQTLKRRIERLEEDNTTATDERSLRIQQERDSLLEGLRATEAQQNANAPTSGSQSASSSVPATMDSEPNFEDSLARAISKVHADDAAEDPTQSARRVKRRLDPEDKVPDASVEPAPATVDGDTVMTEPSEILSSGQPPSTIDTPSNGASDATNGSKRPSSSNANHASEGVRNGSPAAPVEDPNASRGSPSVSKRRRKAKEVESTEASPARQTRSRARAANSATNASAPIESLSTATSVEPRQAAADSPQASQSPAASSSTSALDPIIDPALTAQDSLTKPPVTGTATSATSSQATASTAGSSSSSSTSPSNGVNPYLSLFFPKSNPNGGTPTPTSAHPMPFANPYMFYPMTPITPNSPGYPYNPYLYMGPMMPGYHHPGAPPPSASSPATPSSSTHPVPPQPLPQGPPVPPAPKPKRTKAHPVSSKSFSIPLVPRDKQGKPMLPLNVGIMTVISLGSVCPREHFHTERYIFPVGYEVTRRYLSTIDPSIEVVYHCTILDGGDGPKFQIVPSDTPDKPVIAGTATGAWSSIVKQANAIRSRQHSNSVSGPDFFGLGQNTIKHLIQELPGADKLKNYVWQYFIEGGPLGGRHASVIPALPEEYDASVPRGPVYHTPLEREKLKMADGNASPGEMPKGLSHYPQHIIAQAQTTQPHAGPSHVPGPLQAQLTPPLPPPPNAPMPTAGLPTIPSMMAVNPATLPSTHSPCSVGSPRASPPPHASHVPVAPSVHAPAHRKSASAQVQQIQAQVQAAQPPAANGHAATFIPSAGQPTPISPNTPAPSIASIMNAYRPAAS
ncbi:transforming growth factor beta regulator 1 [Coprinopsis sp. MPI-PUGE-AT-0042]|nr:transforming growth factor beta regulator 1 [Coprinopsis sp. MPI-PUGE-AT-0042]